MLDANRGDLRGAASVAAVVALGTARRSLLLASVTLLDLAPACLRPSAHPRGAHPPVSLRRASTPARIAPAVLKRPARAAQPIRGSSVGCVRRSSRLSAGKTSLSPAKTRQSRLTAA